MSNVQICNNPLTFERKDYSICCGLSVREILAKVDHEWVLDGPAIITLESENNIWVVKDFDTIPAPGETLGVRVIPSGGGGGGGKNPIGILLSVVVLVASIYFPPLAAAYFGSQVAGIITTVGIAVVGGLASNALAGSQPNPSASGITQNSQTSSTYTITGTQNTLNKYGPIPTMVGGTTRIWPTLAASPYTEVVGEDQYLRQRFAIIGPVELSDFKIGETDINNYEDVEIEWIQGFAGDTTPTLYADEQDISEESLNIALLEADGWATRTTQTQTKEVIYDIQQVQLFKVSGSKYIETSVVYEVSYRETGTSGDWLAPDIGEGDVVDVGDGDATQVTITGYYTNSRLFSYRFNATDGQYDVRWRRITEDNEDSTTIFDSTNVSVLRSIAEHPGIDADRLPQMAIVDLRIKATGQLNGIVDQFNCIASAYLPVYDGISTVNYELSDNPAWAFFNVLYGLANKSRVTDLSRFDLDGLIEWATLCDAHGWKINGIIDTTTTTAKMLQTIAAVGRSSLSMVNNKYGVATDWEKDTVIQVFTPRNSWGFESTKIWPEEIHAVRAQFVDETSGYEQGERTVYADGYTSANATKFLDQEIQYVTDPDQVWKTYRYQLADRELRPEIFSFSTDIENLRCVRGDRIRVVHDVMSVGLGQARIKSVTTDGSGNVETATIDSVWTLDETTSYAYNIQRFNGSVYEGFLENPISPEDTSTVTFNPAIPAAVAPSGGELIAFGEADNGVGIDAVIHEVIPGANLTAKLVCQDYAPGIQLAADGTIPPYDSHITVGRDALLGRPNPPEIVNIESDENVLIREADGSLTTRTVLSLSVPDSPIPITSIVIQIRASGNTLWDTVGEYPANTKIVNIDTLVDANVYDFRVQSITNIGSNSTWSYVYDYTIIGKTTPPPAVDTVLYSSGSLRWSYQNKPIDHAGYVVRYSTGLGTNWDNAIPAHDGILPNASFPLDGFSGTGLLFLVKAVDIVGLESETAKTINPQIDAISTRNVVDAIDYDPLFPGHITGGTISGGDIVADSIGIFWDSDASVFWGIGTELYWPDELYSKIQYEFCYTVPSDYASERIILDTTTVGTTSIFYRTYDNSVAYWSSDTSVFWGSDSDLYWFDADDLADWLPWPGKLDNIMETEYCFRIDVAKSSTQGIIDEVAIIIDADDITESIENQSISAIGTRLPLTLTYRAIKYVNVRALQDSGGLGVVVVDKDETLGPLVKILDDTGTQVSGVIDAEIGGY